MGCSAALGRHATAAAGWNGINIGAEHMARNAACAFDLQNAERRTPLPMTDGLVRDAERLRYTGDAASVLKGYLERVFHGD